jgi:hypothetical protein
LPASLATPAVPPEALVLPADAPELPPLVPPRLEPPVPSAPDDPPVGKAPPEPPGAPGPAGLDEFEQPTASVPVKIRTIQPFALRWPIVIRLSFCALPGLSAASAIHHSKTSSRNSSPGTTSSLACTGPIGSARHRSLEHKFSIVSQGAKPHVGWTTTVYRRRTNAVILCCRAWSRGNGLGE